MLFLHCQLSIGVPLTRFVYLQVITALPERQKRDPYKHIVTAISSGYCGETKIKEGEENVVLLVLFHCFKQSLSALQTTDVHIPHRRCIILNSRQTHPLNWLLVGVKHGYISKYSVRGDEVVIRRAESEFDARCGQVKVVKGAKGQGLDLYYRDELLWGGRDLG